MKEIIKEAENTKKIELEHSIALTRERTEQMLEIKKEEEEKGRGYLNEKN